MIFYYGFIIILCTVMLIVSVGSLFSGNAPFFFGSNPSEELSHLCRRERHRSCHLFFRGRQPRLFVKNKKGTIQHCQQA